MRGMPQRNLAVEMLRNPLNGEIKARCRKNVVHARSFAELLENAIKKCQDRAIAVQRRQTRDRRRRVRLPEAASSTSGILTDTVKTCRKFATGSGI